VSEVQGLVRDLQSGAAKVCPRCGKVKSLTEFADGSLVTGQGRFCRECKSLDVAHSYRDRKNKQAQLEGEPSRSDINKLLSFSADPEKYATGTSKSKEKVEYLDSIQHVLSQEQLATYIKARKRYLAAVLAGKMTKVKKADYSNVLAEAFNSRRSVKIRYKGAWRKIDPYSLDDTYVVAYCHFARDMRTFRIDRMQGAELSDAFSPDRTLQTTAQSKLNDAPSYARYGHRR